MTIKLKSAHIENFKSLGNITLNFKGLTILVGANSSGKSNCLEALRFLSIISKNGSPPSNPKITDKIFRVDGSNKIKLSIMVGELDNTIKANYTVSLATMEKQKSQMFFDQENLYVNHTDVISVKNGKGEVKDENGQNPQKYNSKTGNLALKTAGDFGDKPFTSKIAKFIESWKFYDLDPDMMRASHINMIQFLMDEVEKIENIPSLGNRGDDLEDILVYWSENNQEKFSHINNDLSECLGIQLELNKDEETTIKVKEKDQLEVSLSSMSDGTLRILAYYTLLYEDKLPPLIGMEEPERNLHPGILTDIATILKKLSKRTQIIITTHSSQLLDCFSYDDIMSDVAVILLSKKNDSGTQAIALDELSKKRKDLTEWMQDFGVGSAVYESNLLDEILEKQNA